MVSIILSHDSMSKGAKSHTYHTKLLLTDYYDVLGCFCVQTEVQEYLRKNLTDGANLTIVKMTSRDGVYSCR